MSRVDPEDQSRTLWRLAGMGGTLASEILAGTLIGWGVDTLFGTRPTFLIILTVGGVVVGMTTFIRRALKETKRAARMASGVRPAPPAEDGPDDDPWNDDDRSEPSGDAM